MEKHTKNSSENGRKGGDREGEGGEREKGRKKEIKKQRERAPEPSLNTPEQRRPKHSCCRGIPGCCDAGTPVLQSPPAGNRASEDQRN